MRWKAIPWLTLGTIALTTGAALASASGFAPYDTAVNMGVKAVQGGGLFMMGAGTVGAANHIRGGDWSGALSHNGLAIGVGAIGMLFPTIATEVGGVAAAVIHHPATMAAVHLVIRAFV